MRSRSRREFLADVGKGMLVAGLGPVVAADLGLGLRAEDKEPRLGFGSLEGLVARMQETPLDRVLPMLVQEIQAGTDLRTLIAAGALANARTFGGQDYIGYHTLMALAPGYSMAQKLPETHRALPVLKVLYRNCERMQAKGGRKAEVLKPIEPASAPVKEQTLRQQTRGADMEAAEATFAAIAKNSPAGEAYNHLQWAVQDEIDVHRVVLAWRAWALIDFTGKEQAHTLLRQSVRYCVESEQHWIKRGQRMTPDVRVVVPKLLDQYKLLGKTVGDKKGDDAWLTKMSRTIWNNGRSEAAEAVAGALAEGFSAESVAEAISLAATELVLHDPGRIEKHASAAKPAGSCHGDSVGVHASDAANAWRNIARVSHARHAVASLVIAAFHTAGQHTGLNKDPYPLPEQLEKIVTKDAGELLAATEQAIGQKDQARAAALVHRYGELNNEPGRVFDLLLRYGVSQDGALHAEKYYQTVTEEFALTRPSLRWRHLTALARVTASEFGFPAPGYTEACRLLKV